MAEFTGRSHRRPMTRSAVAIIVCLAASLGVLYLGPGAAWAAGITVYSRTANGNVPPVRLLSLGISPAVAMADRVDPLNNELYVADSGAKAILVFSRTANGNAAPIRTIAGHVDAPGNDRREARRHAFDASAFEEPADWVGVRRCSPSGAR